MANFSHLGRGVCFTATNHYHHVSELSPLQIGRLYTQCLSLYLCLILPVRMGLALPSNHYPALDVSEHWSPLQILPHLTFSPFVYRSIHSVKNSSCEVRRIVWSLSKPAALSGRSGRSSDGSGWSVLRNPAVSCFWFQASRRAGWLWWNAGAGEVWNNVPHYLTHYKHNHPKRNSSNPSRSLCCNCLNVQKWGVQDRYSLWIRKKTQPKVRWRNM